MSDINCFSTFEDFFFWVVANLMVSPLIQSNSVSKNKSWSIIISKLVKLSFKKSRLYTGIAYLTFSSSIIPFIRSTYSGHSRRLLLNFQRPLPCKNLFIFISSSIVE